MKNLWKYIVLIAVVFILIIVSMFLLMTGIVSPVIGLIIIMIVFYGTVILALVITHRHKAKIPVLHKIARIYAIVVAAMTCLALLWIVLMYSA